MMKLIRHSGNKLFRRGELTVLNRNQAVRLLLERAAEKERASREVEAKRTVPHPSQA